MQFEKGYIYHIYNQGNNRQRIFFKRDNYLFFLKKIKTHITPYTAILAWCLMPNHFHLMVLVNEVEIDESVIGGATSSRTPNTPPNMISLNKSIGILLSSYTRAINKQEKTTGTLFRQKTKAECINCPEGISPSFIVSGGVTQINVELPEQQYPQICFNYIHQNPVKAGLVKNPEEWEYSSAPVYAGLRDGNLVNKEITKEYITKWERDS